MALRSVVEHPKFADLQLRLGNLPKYVVLGVLESVWHFCGRFTPQGDIGKYKDEQIAAWIGWEGDACILITSLIESGWLDKSELYRLIVHDWHEHADSTTKKQIGRRQLPFVSGQVLDRSRISSGRSGTGAGPAPGAGTEPAVKPLCPSDDGLQLVPPSAKLTDKALRTEFETEVWPEVWAKIGKQDALTAYSKARRRGAEKAFLIARVKRDGPRLIEEAARNDRTVLYPATYFNAARYLDELPANRGQPAESETRPKQQSIEERYLCDPREEDRRMRELVKANRINP